MAIDILPLAMGAMFIGVWIIIAHIIVGDRSRRRRELHHTILPKP